MKQCFAKKETKLLVFQVGITPRSNHRTLPFFLMYSFLFILLVRTQEKKTQTFLICCFIPALFQMNIP